MSDLTDAIRTKGHWRIDVRPTDYLFERIPYSALGSTLDRTVVRLRGWDFPHIDRKGGDRRGNQWIGGETNWDFFKEVWRFHQSGQFVYLLGIHEDWAEGYERFTRFGQHTGGLFLGVGDALFRITETYEFAARLAVTDAGAEAMRLEVDLRNVAGRRLYVDSPHRGQMDHAYTFDEPGLHWTATVSRADLAGHSRDLAVDAAAEVFARFGWHPARALLQEQQAELRW